MTTPIAYPVAHTVRTTDPTTSHEAATPSDARLTNRRRVLVTFAANPEGLDYVTAADLAGLERHEAMRRISELERLEYLEVLTDDDGYEVKVVLASGRRGRVHRITGAGIGFLRGEG